MTEDAQVIVRKAYGQNGTTYVSIPKQFAEANNIQPGDKLALFVGQKSITIRKLEVPE